MRYDDAMRILLVTLLLGLGAIGCGDDTSSATGPDMTAVALDMATHGDLAIAVCVDAGPKLLGDDCTTDCECDTSMCRQFQMGAVHKCTKPCTVATQVADCPAPALGMCTNNGYCKF
jgi:hypothetical protein